MTQAIGIGFLFDVAQGSANLIRVASQVVVIDCGMSGEEVLQYLEGKSVDTVHALLLSHNDADHAHGLIRLLTGYSGRIERLWYQMDLASLAIKDAAGRARRRLLEAINEAEGDGRIGRSCYLHTTDEHAGLVIWEAPPVRLELLYPLVREHRKALLAGNPNQACGVLKLTCGEGTVVFPGDATLEVWRALGDRLGAIECDILAVPHHGGLLHGNAVTDLRGRLSDLINLYQHTLRSRFAVISVGTNNGYGHPCTEHVHALRSSGAQIMCTQLTRRCWSELDAMNPGLLPILVGAPQRSARVLEDIGCAGTVILDLRETGRLKPRRANEHKKAVEDLCHSSGGGPIRPMCRESANELLPKLIG